MKRRDFLRLLSIAPLAPSVLMAKDESKVTLTLHVGTDKEVTDKWRPIKKTHFIALEDIPKNGWGWFQVC